MSPSGKELSFLAVLLLLISLQSSTAYTSGPISPQEAIRHAGEQATVCGPVADARYSEKSRGGPTFLDFGNSYPDHVFTVVIWERDRSRFPDAPERLYRDKTVCVTGTITSYKGKPQIMVNDPSQIVVK